MWIIQVYLFLLLKKLKFEEFRDAHFKRAILKIRKFSQVIVTKFGIKLWKDVDPYTLIGNFVKIDVKCKNLEELKEHGSSLAQNFRLVESKPLWKYYYIEEYEENKSAILQMFHHSMSDGVGYASILSFTDDKPFSHKINRKHDELPLIFKLLTFLLTPFYLFLAIISSKKLRSKESVARSNELLRENEFKSKYYISEEINFEDIRKCYKRFDGTTFNDYLMGILSVSLKKWFRIYGHNENNIMVRSPIATKGLPTKESEFDLVNKCVGIKYEYPIWENLEEGITKWKEALRSNLNPITIMSKLRASSILSLFPIAFLRKLAYKGFDVDLTFSNFPLSSKNFMLYERKMYDVRPFLNWGFYCNMYMFAYTYVDSFRIHIIANSCLKMNPQQLLQIITKEIKKDISCSSHNKISS